MSKYGSIVPEDIASNTFDFHGASIEIETDSESTYQGYWPAYWFFAKGYYGLTNTNPPPHFAGIKSSKPLIVDQYDFTAYYDNVAMSVKDFKIESSMDGENWDTLFTGVIPNVSAYTQKCEFTPTICKYIRCTAITTYDTRGYSWFHGYDFKIYGTLAGPLLYTDKDAYGIPKGK